MNPSGPSGAALWSYGLATAAFLLFAIRLALRWRANPRALLLLASTLVTAAWAASGAAVAYRPDAATWQLFAVADALRYAGWFAFLGVLLSGATVADLRPAALRALPKGVGVVAAIALLASVLLLPPQPIAEPGAVSHGDGPLVLRLGLAIFGLILVEQLIRRADPQARWALKPLCMALAGVFAFDLFFYADAMLFGRLDPDIFAARGIANVLVIPFVALATARNTGWAVGFHVSRGAVFHTTAVALSGVFLLAVAGAGYLVRYFGGDWGRAIQIELLFAALLVAVLVVSSGSFRSKLRVFVSKHFFSYRYDYREEWLRFTRTLAGENSLLGVQERCIKALADLVESPGGALWLRHDQEGFRPQARWNVPLVEGIEPLDGPLASFLDRTAWVINLDEVASLPARYPGFVVPAWLSAMATAWLVVPLASGTEIIGFVVLSPSRAPCDVNWEVLDLLKTASRQAASYLAQLRATEELLEARKFDAFNRMSAFVVHDLKNLVAQLTLMLKNAERHRDNPEFQHDMLATVEHVVGRMNQLMLQLRTGTTPVEKPRPADLENLVRRVCAAKSADGASIKLQLAPGICTLGHPDRLDHVIAHLVQNALDAVADGGEVTVALTQEGRFAVLEVADTGTGMSPEFVRDRLFKPFETTKPSGMGIGVYESAQYVSALGGQMLVDSALSVGTRVRVMLPLAGAAAVPLAKQGIVA